MSKAEENVSTMKAVDFIVDAYGVGCRAVEAYDVGVVGVCCVHVHVKY